MKHGNSLGQIHIKSAGSRAASERTRLRARESRAVAIAFIGGAAGGQRRHRSPGTGKNWHGAAAGTQRDLSGNRAAAEGFWWGSASGSVSDRESAVGSRVQGSRQF